DLELTRDLQLRAVEAQNVQCLVVHRLCQERLAVATPDDALAPAADLGLAREGELGASDAKNLDQAVVVVGRRAFYAGRAILNRDCNVIAVGRHGGALRNLADVDVVDNAWRILFEINHADDVGIALPAALIGEHGDIAFGTDRDAVGADARDHVAL